VCQDFYIYILPSSKFSILMWTYIYKGKSVSEALRESVNPQYDKRFFIEFQKNTSWQRVVYNFFVLFDIQNNISYNMLSTCIFCGIQWTISCQASRKPTCLALYAQPKRCGAVFFSRHKLSLIFLPSWCNLAYSCLAP
jgi:hypothetical protein